MTAYVVTYDLNNETKRPQIVAYLKKTYPDWAMFSESSYGIETSLGVQDVYNSFKHLLDDDDVLLVIHLRKPWWEKASQPCMTGCIACCSFDDTDR